MDETSLNREVDAILGSGIFQPHWYAAQCGVYFRTHRAAAKHFVRDGMKQLCSPHPLMSPRTWPGHLQDAWRRGEYSNVLTYFQRDPGRLPPLGPLFDPRRLDLDPTTNAEHPGGVLGAFLDRADDSTALPTSLANVFLRDAQATWHPMYERYKSHNKLTRKRAVHEWPRDREAQWRRTIADVSPIYPDNAPLFTVVMPAYNRSSVIAQAIRSVQGQTLAAWELIIVDDGSSDSTPEVAEALARDDSRVKVIRAEHDGVSAARNRGLREATGDYIAFLDTDNVWQPEYLNLMARGMLAMGASVAYAGIELRGDDTIEYRAFEGGLEHLLVLNHIDLNVMVVAHDIAKAVGFDEQLRRWVDHDFAIRIAKREDMHFMPFVGCIYDNKDTPQERITTRESESWQWVTLGKSLVDWNSIPTNGRVEKRVSIVIPVYQDWSLTHKAVTSVLESSGGEDIEIIIVDNGSAPHTGSVLEQLFASDPQVTYRRLPRNYNFAIGCNYGAAHSTGEYICFLNNDTEVQPGWLQPLIAHLSNSSVRGVQPLLVYPDESIQTAGTVFVTPGGVPCHFLTGFPPEDAHAASGESFSAVTAACLLMRASDVVALEGFHPQFVNGMEDVDLCLRALERFGGRFVVEPKSRVTHHESKSSGRGKHNGANRLLFKRRWIDKMPPLDHGKYAKAGLRIAEVGGDQEWVPAPRLTVVREREPESLRWGIRYAATGGERGNRWGDTFYVESLAASLRALGQEVVTYRHGANSNSTFCVDDVNLVIRGLDAVKPIPGKLNILWVISHPTKVEDVELSAYDVIYAASSTWAAEVTRTTGRLVEPLLQATDARTFYPPTRADDAVRTRPPTFVGSNYKDRSRRVVSDALVSGMDFRVIGADWQHLPKTVFERERIPNYELGKLYRDSRIVLADQWPDMAELGFLQNRLFDAVACAAPVVVHESLGISEMFGRVAQSYNGPDELRYLCSPEGARVFGGYEERKSQADDVLAQHSFDARAKELLAAVRSSKSVGKTVDGN